ncbi:class I SAM-dependent methyltransferase [Paenibacillus humicola]|uniref:class I SAM-dependent methyltransferase n=1 Tax=Paenibacillus humicola TaxID=3110540 RepID=UPI00237A1868|nr:class I SAM-dependent methyltransferase [Paenibacillus humicola]
MENKLDSRFFVDTDPKTDEIVFKLPNTWWSRYYEYEWAKQFPEPDDVVLDAASGVDHPFKFYLTTVAREVHACDIDPRIMTPERVVEAIRRSWFGPEAADIVQAKYIGNVHLKWGNLANLPYGDRTFDKVFCISVLEEMPERDRKAAFVEFGRVLKDGGLIVLTFDYPNIDLKQLCRDVAAAGLELAGNADFEKPANAIYTEMWGGLHCFRCVLRKREPA